MPEDDGSKRQEAEAGAWLREFVTEMGRGGGEDMVMNKSELQTILGYLNIGLAIAHNTGVSVGHFGGTDFIQLAQSVNAVLLQAITPAAVQG
jgi:hypothetical protein